MNDTKRKRAKDEVDDMTMNFMALTPIITKKEVIKLTDKIFDHIEKELEP